MLLRSRVRRGEYPRTARFPTNALPTSPALSVPAMAPTFHVVCGSHVAGRRLQRAATVLGSPRRNALARGDGLAGGRRLLGVLGLVVDRHGRLRGVAAGVGA